MNKFALREIEEVLLRGVGGVMKDRQAEEIRLLAAIVQELPRLEGLLAAVTGESGYEDPIYRFYHQSFKVFWLQGQIQQIVDALQSLAPELPLNPWFHGDRGPGDGQAVPNGNEPTVGCGSPSDP